MRLTAYLQGYAVLTTYLQLYSEYIEHAGAQVNAFLHVVAWLNACL